MWEKENAGDSFHDFVSPIRTNYMGMQVKSGNTDNVPNRDVSQL